MVQKRYEALQSQKEECTNQNKKRFVCITHMAPQRNIAASMVVPILEGVCHMHCSVSTLNTKRYKINLR